MTTPLDEVELRLDGRTRVGWKRARVSARLDGIRAFALGLAGEGPLPDDPYDGLTADATCTLRLGGDTVLTGYVEEVVVEAGPDTHAIYVTGRSKPVDLVLCDAPRSWIRNQDAAGIARALARPFGVGVVVEPGVEVGSAFPFRPERGEKVWDALQRAMRMRALLATDDGEGRVVITRAGAAGRASAELRPGVSPILTRRVRTSSADRFSEYTCRGQRAGNDADYGKAVADISGLVRDAGVARYRPLEVQPQGRATPALCRATATWEAARRAGRSVAGRYQLSDWRQDNGALWVPNLEVTVRDAQTRLDGPLLLHAVEWRATDEGGKDGGRTVALDLQPEAGWLPQPPERADTEGLAAWEASA